MQARTFYRGLFWTFGGIGLAGLAAAGLALWLFVAPRAFISLRNETPAAIEVVELSYRNRTLLRDAVLRDIETFSYLRAAGSAEVTLVIKRPDSTRPERHVFRGAQDGHSNCVFRIYVRPAEIEITRCQMFR